MMVYDMQKVADIMGQYFQESKSPRGILFENKSLPVEPSKTEWNVVSDPERLVRVYEFNKERELMNFVNDLLAYQSDAGHHAKLTIEHKKVEVQVYTHHIERVTNLDKEYAKMCDMIFADSKTDERRI